MADDGWRHLLKQAAWWQPIGRLATFALAAAAAIAVVRRGGNGFDVTTPLFGSIAGWATSLVRWPPRRPGD